MLYELLRKINNQQLKPHIDTLYDATSVFFSRNCDKDKICSLHEQHLESITIGKALKRYDDGIKTYIVKTKESRIILGALSLMGNHYDGQPSMWYTKFSNVLLKSSLVS